MCVRLAPALVELGLRLGVLLGVDVDLYNFDYIYLEILRTIFSGRVGTMVAYNFDLQYRLQFWFTMSTTTV